MSEQKTLVADAAQQMESATVLKFLEMVYEQLRPLIIWLGLTELAWISYWLLESGDATPGFTAMR